MAMASACCSAVVQRTIYPVRRPASISLEKEAPEPLASAQPATVPETPKMHSVTIIDRKNRSTHELSVREDQYILQAAKEAGLAVPFSCRQGCCTACAVRIRSGQLHQPEAMGLAPALKNKGYGLLCVGFPLSDLELETQDEDEVYYIQFGRHHGQGTVVRFRNT